MSTKDVLKMPFKSGSERIWSVTWSEPAFVETSLIAHSLDTLAQIYIPDGLALTLQGQESKVSVVCTLQPVFTVMKCSRKKRSKKSACYLGFGYA